MDRSKWSMNMAMLQFLCSSLRRILPTYNTHLLFIIFADSSLFAYLFLYHHYYTFLKTKMNSVQLTWMVFYWKQRRLLKVWQNVGSLKQSLFTLLPNNKVQAQPFLFINLRPSKFPKSLRATYESETMTNLKEEVGKGTRFWSLLHHQSQWK